MQLTTSHGYFDIFKIEGLSLELVLKIKECKTSKDVHRAFNQRNVKIFEGEERLLAQIPKQDLEVPLLHSTVFFVKVTFGHL